jgi:hypothetical protein
MQSFAQKSWMPAFAGMTGRCRGSVAVSLGIILRKIVGREKTRITRKGAHPPYKFGVNVGG